jgi:hypothetical protein
VNTSNFAIVWYKSCSVATAELPEPLPPENYDRIATLPPGFLESLFSWHNRIPPHHSSTIELSSLLILIKGSYPSLRASLPCWEVIVSLVAAVAHWFMQRHHADRYLQSKRPTTGVSAKQLRHVPVLDNRQLSNLLQSRFCWLH